MARVSKPPDERKKDIIIIAKQLFCEYGYDKTTITDISNKLGVAQGLVYHYFKSKSDILYAVVEELSFEHALHMEKLILEYQGSAIDCLHELLKESQGLDQKSEKLFYSLQEDRGILEYIQKKMIVSISPILVRLIEKGNADKSWYCKYPKESADFILHGFSGCLVHTSKTHKNIFKEPFKDIMIRVLGVNT